MEHMNPHHLKILPDLEDFELKKGYMRALIQFAEEGDIGDSESDADSDLEVSRNAGGGNSNALGPEKTHFSCRISSVPAFSWAEDEAAAQTDAELGAADNDSILSASTTQSHGETFRSRTSTAGRELDPQPLTGLRPPPHPARKKASAPLLLRTVEEEPSKRSLSATSSPVSPFHPTHDSLALDPQQPISTVWRQSTSTTPSSSSLSAFSNTSVPRRSQKGSISPRRSESFFRLFRPPSTQDDIPTTFLERRSLTPHDRLAPIPRQEHDPTTAPIPAFPPPALWDAVPLHPTNPGSSPVFGIPLDESVALAPMRIRVSHKGSSVSHRSVPLVVYKCCEFIRRTAPHPPTLFSPSTLHPTRLATLHATFNTTSAPDYTAAFTFDGYAPSDAAHLILLFLASLPKPLIPPSVVKSWIILSRRHLKPGGRISGGLLEEENGGLDFWAEALNRLGTMERNLVKLLLEVFAVVLGTAAAAGGEEERGLAGDVAGDLFRVQVGVDGAGELGGREGNGGGGLLRRMSGGARRKKEEGRSREAVVALGFLVRRRGEYLEGLEGGRGEGGFLPSVGDMKGWKGGRG